MTLFLGTNRLAVCEFTPDQVGDLHEVCGDPRVMRFVGDGSVLTRPRCAEWIEESRAHYSRRGFGAVAVYLKGEPSMIGYCGIVPARRRIDPEIIYALKPSVWGQGIGSELVQALLTHGFENCFHS